MVGPTVLIRIYRKLQYIRENFSLYLSNTDLKSFGFRDPAQLNSITCFRELDSQLDRNIQMLSEQGERENRVYLNRFRYLSSCLQRLGLSEAADKDTYRTAIILAVKNGEGRAIPLLLSDAEKLHNLNPYDIKVDCDKSRKNLLEYAAYLGQYASAEGLLLDAIPSQWMRSEGINLVNTEGSSLLLQACLNKNSLLVRRLLLAGADPNHMHPLIMRHKTVRAFTSPLMKAAERCSVKFFLNVFEFSFHSYNVPNENGVYPIHRAVQKNTAQVVEYLCGLVRTDPSKDPGSLKRVDVNVATRNGDLPLFMALRPDCPDGDKKVEVLLKAGSKVMFKEEGGYRSPLAYLLSITGCYGISGDQGIRYPHLLKALNMMLNSSTDKSELLAHLNNCLSYARTKLRYFGSPDIELFIPLMAQVTAKLEADSYEGPVRVRLSTDMLNSSQVPSATVSSSAKAAQSSSAQTSSPKTAEIKEHVASEVPSLKKHSPKRQVKALEELSLRGRELEFLNSLRRRDADRSSAMPESVPKRDFALTFTDAFSGKPTEYPEERFKDPFQDIEGVRKREIFLAWKQKRAQARKSPPPEEVNTSIDEAKKSAIYARYAKRR